MTRWHAGLAVLFGLIVSACATHPPYQSDAPSDAAAAQGGSGEAVAQQASPAQYRLREIVAWLQQGEFERARVGLVQLVQHGGTGQATARSLLRQLDTDPVELLGPRHFNYTVQAGDTLGGLAAQHLGDPLQFVALARYNQVERPALLQAGQILRIPQHAVTAPASATKAPEPVGRAVDRLESDDIPVAPAAPEAADAPVSMPPPAQLPRPEPPAAPDAAQPTLPQATELHEAAVVHFRNQRLDEAIGLWDEVLRLDPGFEQARGYRLRAQELKRRLDQLEGG